MSEYSLQEKNHYMVLSLSGEIDLQCAPEVRKHILSQLNQQKNLLVDLSAVDYIDSSGVATLVEGYQLAKNNGLEFGLLSVSQPAMQVLQLARLDEVFPIFESVDTAK